MDRLHRSGNYDAALVDLPGAETIEDGVTFTSYFADQEPIDGGLTVVDLAASSCRWPSGNPRDITSFRYCGEAAHGGPCCERHARRAYLQRAA